MTKFTTLNLYYFYKNATFTVKFHVEWRWICPTAEEEYGDEQWELDRVRHERQQGIVPDHVGGHQHRPESQFVNIQEKQRGLSLATI
jgi:hypothetical protein